MPEYHVSGTYGDTVEADDEFSAVERAVDKGGWHWEAIEVGQPTRWQRHRDQVQKIIDLLDVLVEEDRSLNEAPEVRTMLVGLRDEPDGLR